MKYSHYPHFTMGTIVNKKGFTLIEVLITIAIMLTMGTIVVSVFYSKFRTVTVEKDTQNVVSYLDKARNQTLSAVGASSYGVSFSSTTASFFKGTTSSAATIQTNYTFSPDITVSYSLGGGNLVYFNRLTGEPSTTGTITLTSKINSSYTKTVVIRATGLAEVQ